MNALAAKVVLTPALIAAATLLGRRFGHGLSGWFAGLPLTSGPVSVFLAIEQGPAYAAQAAGASLLGFTAFVAFCVTYALLARRQTWIVALVGGLCAFAAAEWALSFMAGVPVWSAFAVSFAATTIGLAVVHSTGPAPPAAAAPRWDLPLRMVVATIITVGLTGAAVVLGPRATGLLSPMPVFVGVLAVFAHRAAPSSVARLLRGVLWGGFSFLAFFVVATQMLPRFPLVATYGLCAAAALLVQGMTLRLAHPPTAAVSADVS